MNRHTKKSLIFSILALAAIAVGLIIFILAADSITDTASKPVDVDDGFAFVGQFLMIFVGAFAIAIIGIVDAVFTSFFVYLFAYFSHQNAKRAIDEGCEDVTLPKALSIISVIEMVIAAIIAVIGLLLIILLFSFM